MTYGSFFMPKYVHRSLRKTIPFQSSPTSFTVSFREYKWVYHWLNILLVCQIGVVMIIIGSPKTLATRSLLWLPSNVSSLANPDTHYILGNTADTSTAVNPYLLTPPPSSPVLKQNIVFSSSQRPTLAFNLVAPVEQNGISQYFRPGIHTGIDYHAAIGTPVAAAADGTVIESKSSGWNSGWGKTIVLSHENGITTRYAHLSQANIIVGSKVKTNQIIGNSGSTGLSTGPHLHFEVHVRGIAINPLI